MTSYATLINIDVDIAQKLVSLVASQTTEQDRQTFKQECKDMIDGLQTQNLIEKILPFTENVLQTQSGEEIESFVQAILSIVYSLSDEVNYSAVFESIIKAFSESQTFPRFRLKALVSLFNLILPEKSPKSQYEVLIALFSFAKTTGQTGLIVHYHSRIEEWIGAWGLTDLADLRKLYQIVSEILSIGGQTSKALHFLIQFFGTYGSQAFPDDVREVAKTAVLSAIKSPVSSFSDRSALLESFSKQELTGELGKLVELLRIICTGQLDTYTAYETSNGAFLTANEIEPSEILYSMRLLTLCSLGCDNPTMTYAQIAAALHVDEMDVETWVVDAVSQDLLEAHMDQFTSTVAIRRCAYISFGPPHWSSLQEKLRSLRTKIVTLLDAVKKHSA